MKPTAFGGGGDPWVTIGWPGGRVVDERLQKQPVVDNHRPQRIRKRCI